MQNVIKITLIRRLSPEQTKPIQHQNLRLKLLKNQTYIRRNYRISYEKLSVENSLKKKMENTKGIQQGVLLLN